MYDIPREFDNVSRRLFVTSAARACLGVGLAPFLGHTLGTMALAAPREGRAKKAIYLFMSGGMSHLDTFDPKPGADSQGPTKSIKTSVTGVQLAEHLPKLASRMDRVALIRSMTSNQGAHAPGRYLAHTSYAPQSTIRHPALGSWVTNLLGQMNRRIPGNVVINGGSDHPGAGFMDLKYAPLPLGNPEAGLQNAKLLSGVSDKDFDRRLSLVARFGQQFFDRYPNKKVKGYGEMYADAVRLMRSDELKAFDVTQEDEQVRDRYGRNRFGQGCLLARRMIERDVRFVEVQFGGWDTHNENFTALADKVPLLDRALGALLDDLLQRGLLDETMVALTSEFGRSPKINESSGRDHHPAAFTALLAGGGVKGGLVYGTSDERGHNVDENEVTVADFNATLGFGLGLPLDKSVVSASGRPFKVANDGQPVTDVFA